MQVLAIRFTMYVRREKQRKCSLGCPILDGFLRGGFPCGSVTELVGENASAKTQISLQLSMTAQLPIHEGGLDGSALYIYTESYFPMKRLRQLAPRVVAAAKRRASLARDRLRPKLPEADCGTELSELRGSGFRTQEMQRVGGFDLDFTRGSNENIVVDDLGAANPCNNVFIRGVQRADELLQYLDYTHGALLEHPLHKRVRLLVVDSIAAPFRSEFDNTKAHMFKRAKLLLKIASKLKRIAEVFDVAVVVTNQVTDYFDSVRSWTWSVPESGILMTSGRRVVPALGFTWAHCVNTRLFLSRTDNGACSPSRYMQIVFSPHLPNVSQEFLVDAHGVRGQTSTEGELAGPCSMECCQVSWHDSAKRPKLGNTSSVEAHGFVYARDSRSSPTAVQQGPFRRM